MKRKTKELLDAFYKECEDEDRSVEYIIQYLQDKASVNHDCVMKYLLKYHFTEKAGEK